MARTNSTTPTYTLAEGCPYADPTTAQRFSDGSPVKGLMLLQDTQLIETLAHFNRERIPERVVHAHAVGAWGEFELTHDISHLTDAQFLNGIGTKSKALIRVSTVGPGRGSADTLRDVRGWALKLFTQEGNQDFVFNDIPVFFVRDPIKFPSLNRSHKRHPATNMTDSTMFWDFHNNNQEGIHALMMLFSDRGTPKSVRYVNGYSGHTYKLTKKDGSFSYVKIHFKSNQGNDTVTDAEATRLAGQDPDNHTADLWNAIESGNFPTWTAYLQVMTPEQAETFRWNIFDMTKIWPHSEFPLVPFGKLTLSRNPGNYFADIEQAAFSPSTMVPGIAPSADPVLQARMFAYPDAARYRLGVNYQHLPCNRPVCPVYNPYQRDGFMNATENYGADPNYVRSSLKPIKFQGTVGANGNAAGGHQQWVAGAINSYTSELTDDDFAQPRAFWNLLAKQEGQQEHLVNNVAGHLGSADPITHKDALAMFARVDPELAERIKNALPRSN
ncbi:catalase-like domain-containing protein [Ilyonectria destructans]|nr:catalase-like domain-containing protein [Ilyonectria destructans]